MIGRLKASVMTMSENKEHHLFILHTRKYRDTSLIAEVFSREEGRFSLVFRGARSGKSKIIGLLQPFTHLLVNLFGKGDLRTATSVDVAGKNYRLTGECLLMGMYVNELLYRVLGKFDPLAALYYQYENLLAELEAEEFHTLRLREFELSLLANLGYGITFDVDVRTGDEITDDTNYRFIAEQGFSSVPGLTTTSDLVSGRQLRLIAGGNYSSAEEHILKSVTRKSFRPLLGGKPLKSRTLFEGRK